MEELAKRKDITVTNTDKGGAVVIMDAEKYINKTNRQLSDKLNYKTLRKDPKYVKIFLLVCSVFIIQ